MNKQINPLNHNSYFSYLKEQAKYTPIAQRISGIYKFLKKYILVGRIFRYARIIYLWIQTGAFFILYATSVIFILPIILIASLTFLIYSFYSHRKNNKYFLKIIKNNIFYIIFLEDEEELNKKYGITENGIAIYVIKNPFSQLTTAVKKQRKNVYLISMSYFYCLKKHILEKHNDNVRYMETGDL